MIRKRMGCWPGAMGTLLLAATASGCSAAASRTSPVVSHPPPAAIQQPAGERYHLRSSDVVEVAFPFAPEFNQSVAITPDGYLSLRGVDDIEAAGLTLPELKGRLERAYAAFMVQPAVDVVLREFEHPFFIVVGEVKEPGKYELRGPTTMVAAVAIAGGFTGAAKYSRVWLFRRTGQGAVEARQFDMKQMLNRGQLGNDWPVEPGDVLFVPTSAFSKIEQYLIIPMINVLLRPYFW